MVVSVDGIASANSRVSFKSRVLTLNFLIAFSLSANIYNGAAKTFQLL